MSPRSPLSEGEIDSSGDEEKAISTNTSKGDNKVNMSVRLPSASSSRASHHDGMNRLTNDVDYADAGMKRSVDRSSYRRDRSRSRSPYRAGRPTGGEKRRHEDDHYSRKGGSDPRRFKVRYEADHQPREAGNRSRRQYTDLDQMDHPKGLLSYDDSNERVREPSPKHQRERDRERNRSRSPFRHNNTQYGNFERRDEAQKNPNGGMKASETRTFDKDKREQKGASAASVDERESTPQKSYGQNDAKVTISLSQHSKTNVNRSEDPNSQARMEPNEQGEEKVDTQGQPSEAQLIEQRRKRREAIKARHKSNPPLLVQALEQNLPSAPATPLHESSGVTSEQQSPPTSMNSPQTPQRDSPPDSPAAFAVTNDEELVDRRNADNGADDEEGPSAADYDPNLDMEEDRPEHKRLDLQPTASQDVKGEEQQEPENAPKPAKEFDMFAEDDDDDDMFAPADSTVKPAAASAKQARALDESLLDNWDYPDGHYRIILGELLDGRYAVQQQIGKGTFATVVRAQDTRTGNAVAVKIACNNETMYKAGTKEMDMLQILNQNDLEDKKHIIRLLRHFDHKGHLCLVFENLSADLREVLKKFGRNVGLNLKAIRSYAQQMFLSLGHLKKCQILHADLKPDNILVSEKRSLLKICDLGTAAFADDAEITPYLVSRFYRAPEVILGIPFDYAIDMWSIGCTLFELYTGRILFAGADNNQMLRTIQECRGKFPIRMLKRSTLADRHFDMDGNFFSQERDKITGKATMRQINFNKTVPGKDLRSRLSGNTKGMKPEEVKEHASFVDLMDKCLQLDPARRISPNEALRHSFIAHTVVPPHTEKAAPAVKVAMNVPRRA